MEGIRQQMEAQQVTWILKYLVVLQQVSGADRLPADQPASSCGLLPQHRVPAV